MPLLVEVEQGGKKRGKEGRRRGENTGACTPYEFHARDVNNRYVSYVCSLSNIARQKVNAETPVGEGVFETQ